jgi:hypothetical protein
MADLLAQKFNKEQMPGLPLPFGEGTRVRS